MDALAEAGERDQLAYDADRAMQIVARPENS